MDEEMQNVTYICSWNDLCRLCLRSEQPLKNLFFDNSPLLENVREATSLCFNEDESLPDSVCQPCIDQVNAIVEFRERCRAADEWIRHEAVVSEADQKDTKLDHDIINPKDLLIEPDQYDEQLIDDPDPIDEPVENEIELAHCVIQTEEVLPTSVSEDFTPRKSSFLRPVHKCKICNRVLFSANTLATHMRSHSEDRPYGCNVCEKFFKTKSNLNEHYRVHNPQLRWMKTSSRNLPSLTRVTVTSVEALTCGQCYESFDCLEDLAAHEAASHPEGLLRRGLLEEEEPPLETTVAALDPSENNDEVGCSEFAAASANSRDCPFCGKSFRSVATLENHKRVHTREKPFLCELCSKPFRTKGNLLEHKRVHDNTLWLMKSDTKLASVIPASQQLLEGDEAQEGENHQLKFKCTFCLKPFRTHTALLNHERVHTREKPFECYVCNKRFRTKSNMKEHVKGCHETDWANQQADEVEVFTFQNNSAV